MFRFDGGLKVFLHRDAVDGRKGINGLVALVEQALKLDPFAPVKRNLKLIQLRTQTQLEINTPTHAVIGWVLPPLNCVCV
ncbi:IS66 family insertion sequence element accessory protein TnpB [Caballeronia sp. DA-9]|uniref:IS66 family insertion sequence element accessory protein TnpB n=1 Tax=Caballeronia sp. DA-9 TaxID=3436237 RepID=UPI003F669F2D